MTDHLSKKSADIGYDLIAIDLDGTLLCQRGKVSTENLAAIERARSLGVRVTICTGRGMIECRHITDQIRQKDPVVVAGGAMLACPQSLATLHRFPMERELVGELVDCVLSHRHAVMLLKDPAGTVEAGQERGYDYLVVSPSGWDGVDPVTKWWFDALKVPVKLVDRFDQDPHPELTVRVGVCGTRRATAGVAADIRRNFGHRATLQHFNAVVPGVTPPTDDDHILILEAFDQHVNKWTAISWLARSYNIEPSRIAAIGNDVNDVDMLRNAALGVAMANAIAAAKDVAHKHTLDNDSHGVAHAIDQILRGQW